ncbi:hypothetical protein NU688_07945 [Variovorax sp. ZS18.2.2]|uniref:hypothetical protein n=1 Tax=Variovorax sp. ZS18.2.2 TaxID=2971255 RepID=UPI00215102F5|nr:hypothetical protein [Variovorax sp. ZS18.2.2]MCR6476084.1 hypothetical protein [Variovorax sp. ZS18.2.2]
MVEGKSLVDFLERPIFFDQPYSGSRHNAIVVTDLATDFSCSSAGSEEFEDWQALLDQESRGAYSLPKNTERKILDLISSGLSVDKNYSSAPEQLLNNMEGDIYRLLCCHASGELPALWKKVERVYLENGIPCGWRGAYPEGRIVVYSNSREFPIE